MSSFALVLTTYCVNLAIFLRRNCGVVSFLMLPQPVANRTPDHHSYTSYRTQSHCLGLPPLGALRRSYQALLLGVSFLC